MGDIMGLKSERFKEHRRLVVGMGFLPLGCVCGTQVEHF